MEREEKCQLAIEKGFKYNPETGDIIGIKGKIMNKTNTYNYICIEFRYEKKLYRLRAHQLAWYITHGEIVDCIDHINGNRLDNRICNLRSVTRQENNFNYTKAKGYSWNKRQNKWCASIKLNRKSIHLGSFDNECDARQAYLDAKEKYHKIENSTK